VSVKLLLVFVLMQSRGIPGNFGDVPRDRSNVEESESNEPRSTAVEDCWKVRHDSVDWSV